MNLEKMEEQYIRDINEIPIDLSDPFGEDIVYESNDESAVHNLEFDEYQTLVYWDRVAEEIE